MTMESKEAEVTAEQKQLAEFIKGTHVHLRKESEIYGANEAWQRHVVKADILQSYAKSMKKLATEYWATAAGSRQRVHCRIEWVKSQCRNYFLNGGEERFANRESDIKLKLEGRTGSTNGIVDAQSNVADGSDRSNNGGAIKLLDVGSCYDPFRGDDAFEVTAVDLAPSCPSVLQCDFLAVKTGKRTLAEGSRLTQLPLQYFDAVVFSLLLEYLPCPGQRYRCCLKAYEVLRPAGLLAIITPDSKHANANAKFMKSWRLALSKLGMMRVSYEKLPHMHCMVYRKCIHAEVARRWATLQTMPSDQLFVCEGKIFIPQDFQERSVQGNKGEVTIDDDGDDGDFDTVALHQLPFNNQEEVL